MKKTLSINLGGRPFVIDEDAYGLLDDYLRQIERRQAGNAETADIERRMADLFAETGAAIIDAPAVRNAIARIGMPDLSGRPENEPPVSERRPKRLYRSRTDRVIGGVCGGLAEYFGIDSTVFRLLFLILLFFGGGFLLYAIFWIIMPQRPVSFTYRRDGTA